MLCKPDLSLFDTMSCFEVMDPKMDVRMHRAEALTAAKASANGVLIPSGQLSNDQKHALMQEFIC